MYSVRTSVRIFCYLLILGLFVGLFSGCSIGRNDVSTSSTPVVSAEATATPAGGTTPEVVTQPVPATSTDCPARKSMRAMVTAPLAMGSHPQIVYVTATKNDDAENPIRRGTIMRYDSIDHTSTEIVNLPADRTIYRIFTSADGQWIFFITDDANARGARIQGGDLQAVRVDGQGLQTIFCGFSYNYLSLSPDRHWLAYSGFHQGTGLPNVIHLFDLETGTDHELVNVPGQKPGEPLDEPYPFSWISSTQLALTGEQSHNYYVLDITGGEHRALSSLPKVTQEPYNKALIDGSSLFLARQQCQSEVPCERKSLLKSTITRQPVQGGSAQTIFENTSLAITDLEALTPQTLLVSGTNPEAKTCEIWSMNADGSNSKRLISGPLLDQKPSCQAGSVALDGIHYLVLHWGTQEDGLSQTYIGSTESVELNPLPNSDGWSIIGGWALM